MLLFRSASLVTPILALMLIFSAVSEAQTSADLAQKAQDAVTIAATAEQKGYVRIIVEFTGPVPASELRPDAAFLAPIKAQIASVQEAIVATHFGSVTNLRPGQAFARGLLLFDITPMFAINVDAAELSALAADSRVIRIHLDRLEPPTLLQSVPLVGMKYAYGWGATGQNQSVAILDTGVQSNHEFLSGGVILEACFSNSGGTFTSVCPNGSNTQTGTGAADPTTGQCIYNGTNLCTHGTHVAGIVAGYNTSQSAGEPTGGVAKMAYIVAVQVFTRINDAATCGGTAPCILTYNSDLISALNWVYQNALNYSGIKLAAVNMSLGGGQNFSACDTDARKPSIDTLRSAGVASVVAAGNNGWTNSVSAPGCISTVITVGSTDKNDVISSFSNMASMVELMAPGGYGGGTCTLGANNLNILSSYAGSSPSVTNLYACLAGTSMATPHVAGAYAAIRSACPTKTVDQILAALQNTGFSIADTRSGGTVSKPRIRVDLALQQLACTTGPSMAGSHDYNANGMSDILWRSSGGNISLWLMNGGQVSSGQSVANVASSWSIVGQRDFNGDNNADILWRDTSGNVAMWLMNGGTISSSVLVGNVSTSWSVVGTGDFNSDGNAEILWRDSSGNVAMWVMNGGSISSAATVGAVSTNWSVAGIGDFNGDGKSDILWRDSSGNVAIWLMNGATISSSIFVGNVPISWSIAGTGDFNGDGRSDILWRDGSGNLSMWLMNGGAVSSGVFVGNVPTSWSIVETGDFNGAGKSDILWRDSSGNTAIWMMNGGTVSSAVSLGNIPSAWSIQGANAN